MPTRWTTVTGNLTVAGTAVLALIIATFAASAQEVATPPAEATPEHIDLRPAHIHEATCDALGDIAYPLNDVRTVDVETLESLDVVGQSTTTVEASLEDLLSAEHAINVHESADNIERYIACGELAGDVIDGQLVVELEELSASGYIGEAVLEDADDGSTTVSVVLIRAGVAAGATPAATPVLGAEPTDAAFEVGTILTTTVDNLRVRAEPTTDASVLTALPEGTQLQVTGGPEGAEGFVWYEVEALGTDEPVTGWVAADPDFVERGPEAD